MTALTRKEESLIRLAIFEANELLMDQIYRDFGVSLNKVNQDQTYKLQELFEATFLTLCDIIEDNNLQR